jgi:uncharacterized protein
VATLGVLVINIQLFSMIEAAYLNPFATGDLSETDKRIWIFGYAFADHKFLNLFSMLFGAGIIMFTERVQRANGHVTAIYYRTLGWLLILGLLHAYLLWPGDVLTAMAISAALVYPLRKWKVRGLITLGLVVMAVPAFNYWLFGSSIRYWPGEAVEGLLKTWKPDAVAVNREITAMTGSLADQFIWRARSAWKLQTYVFAFLTGWQTAGTMIVGMGLYKWGVITAQKSKGFYILLALTGLAAGSFLIVKGIIKNFAAGWSVEYSMFFGWEWNYAGSLFISLFYLSVVMLWVKSGGLRKVQNVLASVGRMSLSNYLLTSFIWMMLFNVFGMFGHICRTGQMLVVMATWVVLILFSVLWLKHYKYGPLEWSWRALTYGKFSNK